MLAITVVPLSRIDSVRKPTADAANSAWAEMMYFPAVVAVSRPVLEAVLWIVSVS